MQRNTVSDDDQHQIVLAIKDYVTQTVTLLHRIYSIKPNPIITPTVDFVELIKKLSDFRRKELESFLDEKLNKRHYYSTRTSWSTNPEAIVAGVILSGFAAGSMPAALTIYGVTVLTTHILEQVSHQLTVKSRAQAVANALCAVRNQEALEAEKVKHESNLLVNTLFTDKNKQLTIPLSNENDTTEKTSLMGLSLT